MKEFKVTEAQLLTLKHVLVVRLGPLQEEFAMLII
jgi:hypothetical protein